MCSPDRESKNGREGEKKKMTTQRREKCNELLVNSVGEMGKRSTESCHMNVLH